MRTPKTWFVDVWYSLYSDRLNTRLVWYSKWSICVLKWNGPVIKRHLKTRHLCLVYEWVWPSYFRSGFQMIYCLDLNNLFIKQSKLVLPFENRSLYRFSGVWIYCNYIWLSYARFSPKWTTKTALPRGCRVHKGHEIVGLKSTLGCKQQFQVLAVGSTGSGTWWRRKTTETSTTEIHGRWRHICLKGKCFWRAPWMPCSWIWQEGAWFISKAEWILGAIIGWVDVGV